MSHGCPVCGCGTTAGKRDDEWLDDSEVPPVSVLPVERKRWGRKRQGPPPPPPKRPGSTVRIARN